MDFSKKNIGGNDRKARIIGGLSLMIAGCLTKNKPVKIAGCVFTVTGVMQKCIFYDILGINTYENEENLLEKNR